MSSLADTISSALQAVGSATESQLRDTIVEFEALRLTEEERVAALATAVAATARNHHNRHRAIYIDAVRTWSLEIAAELKPEPPRFSLLADRERIGEGAEILIAGIDALIDIMATTLVRTQDRLVTELALFSRLLGQNDANTIHRALNAIDRALFDASFRPGDLVMVGLRDSQHVLARNSDLAALEPRGCA